MVEKVIWRYHNGQDGQACVQSHMESSLDLKLEEINSAFYFQLSTFLNGNNSRSFAGFLVPSGKITNLVPLALSGQVNYPVTKKEQPSLLPQLVQALLALLVPSLDKGDPSKPGCQPKPS